MGGILATNDSGPLRARFGSLRDLIIGITLVLPDGSQNYPPYSNQQVTDLMNAARSEPNLDKRAQDMVDAQKLMMDDMPWIPDAFPNKEPVTIANLTAAYSSFAYMFAP